VARQEAPFAHPRLGWHRQDLAANPALPAALLGDVEQLYLLAALAHRGPPAGEVEHRAMRRLNVEHPAAVARQAAAAGVRRLLFLSSIGALGSSGRHPFTPASPGRPTSVYGASKLAAEDALRLVAAETGLAVTVLRPPLVIGPGAPGNLPRLIAQARAGRPLPSGTRHNRRSLVGLTGMVEAMALAAKAPAAAGQTYLVAESPPLSTGALFAALAAAAGCKARFLPLPTAPLAWLLRSLGRGALADGFFGDLVIADERLADLGWRPTVTLAQEITRAVQAGSIGCT
jgi:nucleoside-diphosphate-sugar epimerase